MAEHMGRFEHGGDIYGRKDVVDFSANINPLGMPQVAREAIVEHMGDYEAYPDFECRDLRKAIARAEGTQPGCIVCTAGASDLFQRLCLVLKPRTALVTAPCFSGYEQALEQAGARIVRHALRDEDDYDVTEGLLAWLGEAPESAPGGNAVSAAVPEGVPDDHAGGAAVPVGAPDTPDMLFLCNPNNPTGRTIDRGLLERVLDAACEAGVMVVLDECFLDFTGEPSAVELCPHYPNLVVARAFTKMYAMAGLRAGYGICSDEMLVERLAQAGQPWAVSGPAQVAAVAALGEAGWVERTRRYVDEQREVLARALGELGMRVVQGQANYLLFQSERALYGPLLERGFLIRRCGNFQGLDDNWYRIAVRTLDENEALIAALKEVCA